MLEIRFEDAALAVISKPAGLTVHPGAGHPVGTLTDEALRQWPELAKVERCGLVHRLDKNTSGLLVLAKTSVARTQLGRQFMQREVYKRYQALVQGVPQPSTGKIVAPITRHHADRKRMTVRPDGRPAETTYRTVRTFARHALLDVEIATGRTHQIRVHLAALGHPVVGDATYGVADPRLPRQFLHAVELAFSHPDTNLSLTVTDELPADLRSHLVKLKS